MINKVERISDELYEEMDLWFGALVRAFCDEMDKVPSMDHDFTEAEAFLDLWKHEVKLGMGVSCIRLRCEYCLLPRVVESA